ncbi:hypothetical protein BIW11_13267 [Tropilaelaps mercedesae]|uniref:Uncharacterized protein n=1 Tax=Tropilaelaps mercedesae TaxID=418985 RepID=A0A1V9X2Z5_9ACAR|nr:hypothetical protein BIW11_13267 [Tropilaelaps mercedesae]
MYSARNASLRRMANTLLRLIRKSTKRTPTTCPYWSMRPNGLRPPTSGS